MVKNGKIRTTLSFDKIVETLMPHENINPEKTIEKSKSPRSIYTITVD